MAQQEWTILHGESNSSRLSSFPQLTHFSLLCFTRNAPQGNFKKVQHSSYRRCSKNCACSSSTRGGAPCNPEQNRFTLAFEEVSTVVARSESATVVKLLMPAELFPCSTS